MKISIFLFFISLPALASNILESKIREAHRRVISCRFLENDTSKNILKYANKIEEEGVKLYILKRTENVSDNLIKQQTSRYNSATNEFLNYLKSDGLLKMLSEEEVRNLTPDDVTPSVILPKGFDRSLPSDIHLSSLKLNNGAFQFSFSKNGDGDLVYSTKQEACSSVKMDRLLKDLADLTQLADENVMLKKTTNDFKSTNDGCVQKLSDVESQLNELRSLGPQVDQSVRDVLNKALKAITPEGSSNTGNGGGTVIDR